MARGSLLTEAGEVRPGPARRALVRRDKMALRIQVSPLSVAVPKQERMGEGEVPNVATPCPVRMVTALSRVVGVVEASG